MSETLLAERYRLIRVLGSGGFGETYVAEDIQTPAKTQCVVKHLKPASQDARFLRIARRLFDTEASTLQRLGQHSQIPRLLGSFEEGKEFYLVQEFVEGRPLNQELRHRRLSEGEVIELLRDVLSILDFVHQHHVIHRDIKPDNLIRRQEDGRLVLIDFGAVKEIRTQLLSGERSSLTVGIGTQGYTPSEQLAGKPRYSSDIYALGVTAIQALTGFLPSELPEDPSTAELLWQDKAQVSPGLGILLSKMVRHSVHRRYQTTTEVLRDLDRLEELPNEITDAEELPVTYIPGAERWGALVQGVGTVAIATLATTTLLLGLRYLGLFVPLELKVYDWLVRHQVVLPPDPRLLVVEVTEADLRSLQRPTPSDQTLAAAIETLQAYQPRVIGLDLYREIPQEPGTTALRQALEAPNVVVITKLGSDEEDAIPPPEGVPLERVGFNDFPVDTDGVIRRNLLFATANETIYYSFGLRLALPYLAAVGIEPTGNAQQPDLMQLGDVTFYPLSSHSGAYQSIDAQGYQLRLTYRSPDAVAERVSLSQVLAGDITREQVQDRIVLIGMTAPSGKDLLLTPYSATLDTEHLMPGVILHAQAVSQVLSLVLDGQTYPWSWPEWLEILGMLVGAGAAGSLAWWVRQPLVLGLSGSGLVVLIVVGSGLIFRQGGWVPTVAPITTLIMTGGAVVAYRAYDSQQQQQRLTSLLLHRNQQRY